MRRSESALELVHSFPFWHMILTFLVVSSLSISPLKLGSAKRVSCPDDLNNDLMEMDSDIEQRKKHACKATLEFLRASKKRAEKAAVDERNLKPPSSAKPNLTEVESNDYHDMGSSEGHTDSDEGNMQFINITFNVALAHFLDSIGYLTNLSNNSECRKKKGT